MKKVLIGVILSFFCCGLYAVNNSSVIDISAGGGKTEVIIIGTIHEGHHKNSKYSCEVLKEIILSLKPDVILDELPLSLVDPNGRPIKRLRDKQTSPESWATSTVAEKLGIKQIPFDRPDRQENFRKTNYFERQEKSRKLEKQLAEQLGKEDANSFATKIAAIWGYSANAEADLFQHGCPEIINSETHDYVIRIKMAMWYDVVPNYVLKKYPGYEELVENYHFFRDQWDERNRIMADNIIKAAKEYRGKRLVVVTGATHRYILRDLLKDEEYIELKEYWQENRN